MLLIKRRDWQRDSIQRQALPVWKYKCGLAFLGNIGCAGPVQGFGYVGQLHDPQEQHNTQHRASWQPKGPAKQDHTKQATVFFSPNMSSPVFEGVCHQNQWGKA